MSFSTPKLVNNGAKPTITQIRIVNPMGGYEPLNGNGLKKRFWN